VVTIVSGMLFLGYAKVGSRSDPEVPETGPPAFGRHGLPPERPPATVGRRYPALVGTLRPSVSTLTRESRTPRTVFHHG
jgi:hypothetical protein